jgi:hypothetical protein
MTLSLSKPAANIPIIADLMINVDLGSTYSYIHISLV